MPGLNLIYLLCIPVIAVAIAESVLFYRNLKPYFKYTVPALDADELELELWRKLPVMKSDTHDGLLQLLNDVDHALLSRKTQRLLQLSGEERDVSFVNFRIRYFLQRFLLVVFYQRT